jgi:hypothetical protein
MKSFGTGFLLTCLCFCGGHQRNIEGLDVLERTPIAAISVIEDLSVGTALSDARGTAGGSMLAEITGISVDSEGRIYILDPSFGKIAVFDASGHLKKVIIGERGQGPGEFDRPIALSVSSRGVVGVFDYGNNRLSLFNNDGSHWMDMSGIPRTRDIFLGTDAVWGTYYPGRSHLLWMIPLDDPNSSPERLIEITDRDRVFYPRGSIARLGRARDGGFIVGSMRPGIWYKQSELGFKQKGVEALPNDTAFEVPTSDLPFPPAATVGLGCIDPGLVVIAYMRYNQRASQRSLEETRGQSRIAGYSVDVFTLDGTYLGTTDLATDNLSAFTTAPGSDKILFTRYDPYPQVVRAVLSVEWLGEGPGGLRRLTQSIQAPRAPKEPVP